MSENTRWGIISTGSIANKFAQGLESAPDAELVAVGSRSQESADAFGDKYNIPHRHASYEALAADADVDAVYIGTPHNLHKENTLLCIEAGKAVLCEKPFAINAAEATEMVQAARDKGIFLMEAMWTRYIPAMVKVRELLAEGVIGDVRMIMADFGFRAGINEEGRLFNPKFGGGGLLDVGVYPISLSSMILGRPERIVSMAEIGSTGVDEQAAMVLGHPGGELAVLATGIRTNTPQGAHILGTDGRIFIHSSWWKPETITLSVSGKDDETIDMPFDGNGYNYEAVEVGKCLHEGKLESDTMPLKESLEIMATMDQIRAQWNLKYPME